MFHCEEHIPVLEAAKEKASARDQEELAKLQQMSMLEVALRQRQATREMATNLDRILSALPIVPKFIEDLSIHYKTSQALRQRTQANLQTRLIRINVEGLLDSFLTLLRNPATNPRTKAVILLLVTGRRCCEVLATGQFVPIAGRTYTCVFHGHLKNDFTHMEYRIPLLAPVDEVNKYVAEVRTALGIEPLGIGLGDQESRTALNLKYATQLKTKLNEIIRPFTISDMKPNDMRSLYVLLAHQACAYINFPLLHFAKAVLGHRALGL
jgi:hypothetical protein